MNVLNYYLIIGFFFALFWMIRFIFDLKKMMKKDYPDLELRKEAYEALGPEIVIGFILSFVLGLFIYPIIIIANLRDRIKKTEIK